ncbi:hypothetical protein L7F22_007185 [Adiantum nelumboides]|nr:hypothetical protein [Adiantum nelumboides]
MHDMVPNPMYADIGLQPGFEGTQGQFGVSQGNLGKGKQQEQRELEVGIGQGYTSKGQLEGRAGIVRKAGWASEGKQESGLGVAEMGREQGNDHCAAMGVFDAIQLCRAPVSTIVFGFAASTAAILLASGSKGKRLAMPNARIMLHQPMGGASGQAIDVEIQAKEIMHHKTNIARILSQITGRTYEQIEEDIDQDRYLSPVEAVEYGILDGVIDKDSILPLVPMSEKVTRRSIFKDAESDPRKFLIPVIPDDEIY